MSKKELYDTQTVLELACAAQRVNGAYLKDSTPILTSDDKIVAWNHANKSLISFALKLYPWQGAGAIPDMTITDEDRALAADIRAYYKRLVFSVMATKPVETDGLLSAITSGRSFDEELLSLLNSPEIPSSKFGYFACLPSTMNRDRAKKEIKKAIKDCDQYLGDVGVVVKDKDCEILSTSWSTNYECWNVLAIVDNCCASWMSKKEVKVGPAVLTYGRIKANGSHWLHKVPETRLNFVKVFQ